MRKNHKKLSLRLLRHSFFVFGSFEESIAMTIELIFPAPSSLLTTFRYFLTKSLASAVCNRARARVMHI